MNNIPLGRTPANKDGGASESGRGSRDRSLFGSGVGAGVVGAARSLRGREFHKFDAGIVGVVKIELPFAAAADLGFFVAAQTVLAKLRFCGVDVRDAEGDVVHDAKSVMVRVG